MDVSLSELELKKFKKKSRLVITADIELESTRDATNLSYEIKDAVKKYTDGKLKGIQITVSNDTMIYGSKRYSAKEIIKLIQPLVEIDVSGVLTANYLNK